MHYTSCVMRHSVDINDTFWSKVSVSKMSVYVSVRMAPGEIATTCTYCVVASPTVFVLCLSLIYVVLCESMEKKLPLW